MRDFRSDLGVLYLSTFNESVIGHALSDANLSFNLLFTAQPHVFVSDKHPLASRTEVTVEDLEDYPRYAFELLFRGTLGRAASQEAHLRERPRHLVELARPS